MTPLLQEMMAPFTVTKRTAVEQDAFSCLDSRQSESIHLSFSFVCDSGRKSLPMFHRTYDSELVSFSKLPTAGTVPEDKSRQMCPAPEGMEGIF